MTLHETACIDSPVSEEKNLFISPLGKNLSSHSKTRRTLLTGDPGATLVERLFNELRHRIDQRLLRPGSRLPSIRQCADRHEISRFTVVEAYERLVAQGYLESRRGSGFYVRERRPLTAAPTDDPAPPALDVVWLVRAMFRDLPPERMPGSGLLPPDWLDSTLLGRGLRSATRGDSTPLLGYGEPQGYAPLRNQLQVKLAEIEIAATPEQMVLTAGVTQALDLIARQFLRPGDAVLVDDPGWFLMFGMFAALGARPIGVPRQSDGPDLAVLEQLLREHRPPLYVTTSVLHNPTGTSLTSAKAFQILRLAEQYDVRLVEDDIYADFCEAPAVRLAALDQLRRVIYVGSFSKTVAANLRVGFIAGERDLARALADRKLLAALTTPELGERVMHHVLAEGHYRKHVERLRGRLAARREPVLSRLEQLGLRVFADPQGGMFAWLDAGRDSHVLAARAYEQRWLLAPGSLFSPGQLPSSWLRFNLASSSHPDLLRFLEQALA